LIDNLKGRGYKIIVYSNWEITSFERQNVDTEKENKEKLMNKKSVSIFVITATFVIIASTGVMIVLHFQPDTVAAKSIEPVSSFNENLALGNAPVPTNTISATVEYPLVQEVNGIKIEVTGTAIGAIEGSEGKYFTADICYDLPSQKTDYVFTLGGQTPGSITLTTANETIQIYAWGINSFYNEDAEGNFHGNCARLYFPISSSTNLDNLTLTISRMSTPVADFPDCNKAQKKLDDADQKIKVECWKGGGFGVSEKPDDMSAQEARAIALDTFIDIVEGPWIFKLK
jgi:hypothetical protein